MSATFGFNQAAAIAAWAAFILVPLSKHSSAKSAIWYLKRRDELNLWWAPGISFFPVFWALLTAVLVTDIFYFTQLFTGDTWQYIVGFIMFVIHIFLLKIWDSVFWGHRSMIGAFTTFVFLYGTIIVFLICCIVGQTNVYLYLVPTLLTVCYMLLLLFPVVLNVAFAFPKFITNIFGFSSTSSNNVNGRHRSRRYAQSELLIPEPQ